MVWWPDSVNFRISLIQHAFLPELTRLPISQRRIVKIIILISENEYIGFMIDGVNTVIQSNIIDIGPVPANLDGIQGIFFKGVLQTEDQLIGILRTKIVLSL